MEDPGRLCIALPVWPHGTPGLPAHEGTHRSHGRKSEFYFMCNRKPLKCLCCLKGSEAVEMEGIRQIWDIFYREKNYESG